MPPGRLGAAVLGLHREKSAAYGNAWKKRGEVLSVLANLARKVDRLAAGSTTRDETPIDTAVDLLVYAIKYQTYLADLDEAVAATLFDPSAPRPFSDGTAGFEVLWASTACPVEAHTAAVPDALRGVDHAFTQLEGHFDLATPCATTLERAASAAALTHAAAVLVAALTRTDPEGLHAFLDTWDGR